MEENKNLNEVVEESKKEEKVKPTTSKKTSTSAKKETAAKKTSTTTKKAPATKKTGTTTKKASTTKKVSATSAKKTSAKKDIPNPLDDMPPVKKKVSGASSIEKALEKKIPEKIENADVSDSKEDMKARMQRIINASKKLNDSILEEDTKKAQMKEKLANAAQEMELEYGKTDEEPSVADSYAEKNAKLKGKYDDLSKKLAAMMAESNLYDEEALVEEENTETLDKQVELIPELEQQEEVKVVETEIEISAKEETQVEQTVLDEVTKEEQAEINLNSLENQEVKELVEEKVEVIEEVKEENVSAQEIPLVKEDDVVLQETNEDDLGNQIVMDIVKEHRAEQAKQEEQTLATQEIVKEEIIDTSIPELSEKPVSKKSIFKKILDYIIKTMNGMAYGLFATLIIGTILGTIAGFFAKETTAYILLNNLATLLKNLTGFGIGVGIAWSLKYDGIKLIAIACVGAVAAYFSGSDSSQFGFKVGDPLTIYLVVIATAILLDQIFRKKTPVDIIIIPLFTALFSSALTVLISKYIALVTSGLAEFIGTATAYQPILMGIIISVIMGMALTAPISSAAIAAIVFVASPEASETLIDGLALAGGAALVGCCTQMVGFAIMSRKDNNFGTCVAIGVGTSMLQFKNILRKPVIWLPTIIVSAILGPIATTLIQLECMGTAAGMGTSGLVGMIGTFDAMGMGIDVWLIVLGFEIILPTVLVLIVDIIFRKFNLIKEGDLKL